MPRSRAPHAMPRPTGSEVETRWGGGAGPRSEPTFFSPTRPSQDALSERPPLVGLVSIGPWPADGRPRMYLDEVLV